MIYVFGYLLMDLYLTCVIFGCSVSYNNAQCDVPV
jgi:hypothetical protein